MKLNNKYYIMRHGQAISNVKDIVSSWPEKFKNPLTGKGIKMAEKSAQTLKNKKIDMIFCSPLLRTRQTAKIVGNALGIKPKTDKRLKEIGFGIFNAKPLMSFLGYFKTEKQRIKTGAPKGESYQDVLKKALDFLIEIDKKYKNKNILIISHETVLTFLEWKVKRISLLQSIKDIVNGTSKYQKITPAEIRELN